MAVPGIGRSDGLVLLAAGRQIILGHLAGPLEFQLCTPIGPTEILWSTPNKAGRYPSALMGDKTMDIHQHRIEKQHVGS